MIHLKCPKCGAKCQRQGFMTRGRFCLCGWNGLSLRDRSQSMSVQILREELPEWSWRAVRAGMGWRYEGHRGNSRVTVQAEAVLCGPGDDDFSVRWKVYETGESYATWYCREITRLKAEGVRDA